MCVCTFCVLGAPLLLKQCDLAMPLDPNGPLGERGFAIVLEVSSRCSCCFLEVSYSEVSQFILLQLPDVQLPALQLHVKLPPDVSRPGISLQGSKYSYVYAVLLC